MMKLLVASLVVSSVLSAATATPPPTPDVQRLYRARCGGCHGLAGEGLIGPSFKKKLVHSTPDAMFLVVKNGIPGTAMPACSAEDAQIKKLVTYVLWLHKQAAVKSAMK